MDKSERRALEQWFMTYPIGLWPADPSAILGRCYFGSEPKKKHDADSGEGASEGSYKEPGQA